MNKSNLSNRLPLLKESLKSLNENNGWDYDAVGKFGIASQYTDGTNTITFELCPKRNVWTATISTPSQKQIVIDLPNQDEWANAYEALDEEVMTQIAQSILTANLKESKRRKINEEYTDDIIRTIAKQFGISIDSIADINEFKMGMAVELEHGSKLGADTDVTGDDVFTTFQIVLAHLKEKSNYYTLLAKYVEGNKNESKSRRFIKRRKINEGLSMSVDDLKESDPDLFKIVDKWVGVQNIDEIDFDEEDATIRISIKVSVCGKPMLKALSDFDKFYSLLPTDNGELALYFNV